MDSTPNFRPGKVLSGLMSPIDIEYSHRCRHRAPLLLRDEFLDDVRPLRKLARLIANVVEKRKVRGGSTARRCTSSSPLPAGSKTDVDFSH